MIRLHWSVPLHMIRWCVYSCTELSWIIWQIDINKKKNQKNLLLIWREDRCGSLQLSQQYKDNITIFSSTLPSFCPLLLPTRLGGSTAAGFWPNYILLPEYMCDPPPRLYSPFKTQVYYINPNVVKL